MSSSCWHDQRLYSPSVSSQSCHDKLIELFSEKLYLIGLAALVVAVIMVSVRVKRGPGRNVDILHSMANMYCKLLLLFAVITTQILEYRHLELNRCVLFFF